MYVDLNVSTACSMLILYQLEFAHGDEIFVNALTDEPINLARPREDDSINDVNAGFGTPRNTILITVKYLDEDDVHHEIHCKMTKIMSFGKLIGICSAGWNIDPSRQRLTFNDKTVFPSDTPALVRHQRTRSHRSKY